MDQNTINLPYLYDISLNLKIILRPLRNAGLHHSGRCQWLLQMTGSQVFFLQKKGKGRRGGSRKIHLLPDGTTHPPSHPRPNHWSSHLLGALLGHQTTAQDTGLLGEVCGCGCLAGLGKVTPASLIRYLVSVFICIR